MKLADFTLLALTAVWIVSIGNVCLTAVDRAYKNSQENRQVEAKSCEVVGFDPSRGTGVKVECKVISR